MKQSINDAITIYIEHVKFGVCSDTEAAELVAAHSLEDYQDAAAVYAANWDSDGPVNHWEFATCYIDEIVYNGCADMEFDFGSDTGYVDIWALVEVTARDRAIFNLGKDVMYLAHHCDNQGFQSHYTLDKDEFADLEREYSEHCEEAENDAENAEFIAMADCQ